MSRVPADMQTEIVRMYTEDRLTSAQISDRTFWSKTAVLNVLRTHNVRLRSPGENQIRRRDQLPDDAVARTVELYQTGLSLRDVSSTLGIARSTARYRLRLAGVQLRSNSDAVTLRRRTRLQRGTPGAFTELQRKLLAEIAAHGEISTPDIARTLGKTNQSTRDGLTKLRRLGYVTSRPTHTGRNHPHLWSLTQADPDAMVQEILSPTAVYGKASDEDMLPIGPFRSWVEDLIAREQRKVLFNAVPGKNGGDGTSGIPVSGIVAKRLGLTDRRLWALRYQQDRISIAFADRILTVANTGDRLEDIWPELELTEAAA